MSLICKPLQALLFSRPSYALPHLAGICKYGGMGIMVPIAFHCSLSSWRVTSPGNACKHGCLRGWDTASQYHTSLWLLALFLEADAGSTGCASDVSPIHWTDYIRDSVHGHAEGVPIAFQHSVSFPLVTMITFVTWRHFLCYYFELYFHQRTLKTYFMVSTKKFQIKKISNTSIFNIIYFTKIHDINNNTNNTAITSTMEYIF